MPRIAQGAHCVSVSVMLTPCPITCPITARRPSRTRNIRYSPNLQMSLLTMGTWNRIAVLTMPTVNMRQWFKMLKLSPSHFPTSYVYSHMESRVCDDERRAYARTRCAWPHGDCHGHRDGAVQVVCLEMSSNPLNHRSCKRNDLHCLILTKPICE